jgi:hypothetical protein
VGKRRHGDNEIGEWKSGFKILQGHIGRKGWRKVGFRGFKMCEENLGIRIIERSRNLRKIAGKTGACAAAVGFIIGRKTARAAVLQ